MSSIRKALKSKSTQVNEGKLKKIIDGYDYILVIPNVTPAAFLN